MSNARAIDAMLRGAGPAAAESRLLDVREVTKVYGDRRSGTWAVRGASLSMDRGDCLALVGESGSGKTTLAGLVTGLVPPTSGRITVDGLDVTESSRRRKGRIELASRAQFVFQDPFGSLDPRMTLEALVTEPLLLHRISRAERASRVRAALDVVGLPQAYLRRRQRELSGGQRQRVGIARALVVRPRLLVLDEPVASLDVSIQGQILQLLKDLRRDLDVAVLMVAHDLGVVRAISDRTAVMYRGAILEQGPTTAILQSPLHPYTQGLLWSATAASRAKIPPEAATALAVDADPVAIDDPGCVFRDRCWRRVAACDDVVNAASSGSGHQAFCNVPIGLEREEVRNGAQNRA